MSLSDYTFLIKNASPIENLEYTPHLVGEEFSVEFFANVNVTLIQRGTDITGYYKLIEDAMVFGNVQALEMLYTGLYFHGDSPNYETDLKVAAMLAKNEEIFAVVMNGFQNRLSFYDSSPVKVFDLIELAEEKENCIISDFLYSLTEEFIIPRS